MKDHRKQKKAAPIEEQSREEKGLKEDLPQGNGKDKTDDGVFGKGVFQRIRCHMVEIFCKTPF